MHSPGDRAVSEGYDEFYAINGEETRNNDLLSTREGLKRIEIGDSPFSRFDQDQSVEKSSQAINDCCNEKRYHVPQQNACYHQVSQSVIEKKPEFSNLGASLLPNKHYQRAGQEKLVAPENETLSLSIEKTNEHFHSISFHLFLDDQVNNYSLRNDQRALNVNHDYSQQEEGDIAFKIGIDFDKDLCKISSQIDDNGIVSSKGSLNTSAQLNDVSWKHSPEVVDTQQPSVEIYQSEVEKGLYLQEARSVTPFCVDPELSQSYSEISFSDRKIEPTEEHNLLKCNESDKILLHVDNHSFSQAIKRKLSKPSTATDEQFQLPEETPDHKGIYLQINSRQRAYMTFEEESQLPNAFGWNYNNHAKPGLDSMKISEVTQVMGQSLNHRANDMGNNLERASPNERQPEPLKRPEEVADDDNSKPLDQCLQSENAKTRARAYEELARLLECADKQDEFFNEFHPEFIKFIAEPEPIVQEKALLAFKIYISNTKSLKIDAKSATKTLIEKGLATSIPNIEKISNDILCIFIEKCEKKAVFEGINESISSKNVKASLAGVKAVIELLKNYGSRKLDSLRPFYCTIERLACCNVPTLRNEAMNFYKEALKWMGEAAKHYISKLKKTQIEELEQFYNDWPKQPMKPIRGESVVLHQGLNKNIISGILGGGQNKSSDPVDLAQKFNNAWCERVLLQQKWSDKKQMLDELHKAVSVPKLIPGKYDHIDALLKRLLNDSNVTLVLISMRIYGALAKVLRKNFKDMARSVCPLLLQKFSDKKSQVVEEINRTFDMLYNSISLHELSDEIQAVLADKNPRVRLNVLSLIERFLNRENLNKSENCWNFFKMIGERIKDFLNGTDESLRGTALVLLEKINAKFGKEAVGGGGGSGNKISQQDQDIQDPFECKKSLSTNMPNLGRSHSQSLRKSDKLQTRQNSTSSLQTFAAARKASSKSPEKIYPSQNTDNGECKEGDELRLISAEEAEAKLVGLGVHDAIFKGLNSADWKLRQSSLGLLGKWISDNKPIVADFPDVLIRFLKTKLKDWKESNLAICKENFAVLSMLCNSREIKLNKRAFAYINSLLVNNCCDVKFKDAIYSIIRVFIQNIAPSFVINSLLTATQSTKETNKNPKIMAEICNILIHLLNELSIEIIPVKDTLHYAKTAIQDSNLECKNAATSLFKAVYSQTGYPIFKEIQDLPADLLQHLQMELKTISPTSENELSFKIELKGKLASDARYISTNSLVSVICDSHLPKVPEKIIKSLSSQHWKIRKEGLDQLEQLLSSSEMELSSDGLQEVVLALKARLDDPKKALLKRCIQLIARLAMKIEKEIAQHFQSLLPSLLKHLSNKHAEVRQEVLACLEAIGSKIGSDIVINSALPFLLRGSSEVRSHVINLALKYPYDLPKVDIRSNINALTCSLQDQEKDVRRDSEKLLEKCIEIIGIEPFENALKPINLSIQKEMKQIISRYQIKSGIIDRQSTNSNDIFSKSPCKSAEKKPLSRSPTLPSKSPVKNFVVKAFQNTHLDAFLTKITPHKRRPGNDNTMNQLDSTPNRQRLNDQVTKHKNTPSKIDPLRTITPTEQKNSRIEAEKKLKWNVTELQDELIEKLKENLTLSLSPELISKMFANDYRKHLEAIRIFKKALENELPATIDILDLIIRWMFTRLFGNSNIQILKGMLDYIFCLIDRLEEACYTFLPFEGQVLVPVLVERFNLANSGIRNTLKTVILRLCAVYPPNAILPLLLQGLNSKSFKICVDCLDTIAEIAKKYGMQAFSSKDIKFFGKLLSQKNMSIKNSTMTVLTELGRIPDYDIFEDLADVPNRFLEQLRSRIQGNAADLELDDAKKDSFEDQNKSISLLYPQASEQSIHQAFDPPKEELPDLKSSLTLCLDVSSPQGSEQAHRQFNITEKLAHLMSIGQNIEEKDFHQVLIILQNGDVPEKLDAMIIIHDLAASEMHPDKLMLKNNSDTLFKVLNSTLKKIFFTSKSERSIKFIQCFLNICHKLCSVKDLVQNISEANLKPFVEEMICNLVAESEEKTSGDTDRDGEQIVKMLNSITLRVLENGNFNVIHSILFDLMIGYRKGQGASKIVELVARCVLKLGNSLEDLPYSIQLDHILLKFHLYLVELRGSEPSLSDKDIGVKTIKTLLNKLVKIFKEKIWEHYCAVRMHPVPDMHLHIWISAILKPFRTSGKSSLEPNQSNQQAKESEVLIQHQNRSSPLKPLSMNLMPKKTHQSYNNCEHMAIGQIIENLMIPEKFEHNILLLYDIILKNPGLDIRSYFRGSSKNFLQQVIFSLERTNFEINHPFAKDGIETHTMPELRYNLDTSPRKHDTLKMHQRLDPNRENNENQFKILSGQLHSPVLKAKGPTTHAFTLEKSRKAENNTANSKHQPNDSTYKKTNDMKVTMKQFLNVGRTSTFK